MFDKIQKSSVVSNTGPLISAFQCEQTDLLKRYFDVIYIVQSQIEEFIRHKAGEWIQRLIDEEFVKVIVALNSEEQASAVRRKFTYHYNMSWI